MPPGALNDIYLVKPVKNMHLNSQYKQILTCLSSLGSAVHQKSHELKPSRSTDSKHQV